MKKKLNILAGIRNFSFRLFLFLSISGLSSSFCQSTSNLDIFFAQIDSVGMEIKQLFPETETKINFLSSPEYSVLENRLISYLIKNGVKISKDEIHKTEINFVITEAVVKYDDSFRDGLFGDVLVGRNISINGNFLSSDKNISKDFSYSFTDTIKYDQLKEFENRAYPFTQNSHPSEPFLSSLIEPVIAIGAAATAVILFFTIRSK